MKHNLRVDEEDFFLQNKVVIVEILDSPQILTIFGISEKKRVFSLFLSDLCRFSYKTFLMKHSLNKEALYDWKYFNHKKIGRTWKEKT